MGRCSGVQLVRILMPDAMGVSMNHSSQRSPKRTALGLLALVLAFVVIIIIGVSTATAGNRQENALLQTTPVIGFSQANYEVTEGNRATITVQISPSPTVTATADYQTQDGTAFHRDQHHKLFKFRHAAAAPLSVIEP